MFGTYLKKYYILCKTHKQYKPVSTKKNKLRVHKQASQQGSRSIQVRLQYHFLLSFALENNDLLLILVSPSLLL
jgi:hypothetical protein